MEYWLQKKNLGGWSTVTWYSAAELAVAQASFKVCVGNGMSGYSWRLMKVEAIEVSMLEEVTEVDVKDYGAVPDELERVGHVRALVKKPWTDSIQPLPMKKPWGSSNAWDAHSANPAVAEANKPEHGLTGSVWLINHKTLVKIRVPANLVDRYIAEGYERGGPKTKFRE